jgi:flagellar biosynthesis/type III secretory pathway chaperone
MMQLQQLLVQKSHMMLRLSYSRVAASTADIVESEDRKYVTDISKYWKILQVLTMQLIRNTKHGLDGLKANLTGATFTEAISSNLDNNTGDETDATIKS